VERSAGELGGIDILVNNAGIALIGPVDGFWLEDFDRIFAVNVRAAFVATQAAIKHMKSGGRVINIGSTNAERMPFSGGSVYAMSKAALIGLAKGLARDLDPRGITVNNVQPGRVDTEMNPADGEFAKMILPMMALPRYAHSDEIAAMVAYLAGPRGWFRDWRQPDDRRRIQRVTRPAAPRSFSISNRRRSSSVMWLSLVLSSASSLEFSPWMAASATLSAKRCLAC